MSSLEAVEVLTCALGDLAFLGDLRLGDLAFLGDLRLGDLAFLGDDDLRLGDDDLRLGVEGLRGYFCKKSSVPKKSSSTPFLSALKRLILGPFCLTQRLVAAL
jgi:hypothetical protein